MGLFSTSSSTSKRPIADADIDITIKTNGSNAQRKSSRSKRKRKLAAPSKVGRPGKQHAGPTPGAKKAGARKSPKKKTVVNRKHATETGIQTSLPAKKKARRIVSPVQVRTNPTQASGSLFRVNRMPLAQYGRKTFLSDSTNINEPLGDRIPTEKERAFVRALNEKFKKLESQLGSQFRAYCGGAAGFVVRRYTLSCAAPTDDVLTSNKPIGMGPKGLDKYFRRHYAMSWDDFLTTPSATLVSSMKRGPATQQTKKTVKKVGIAKPAASAPVPKRKPSVAPPANATATQSPAKSRRPSTPSSKKPRAASGTGAAAGAGATAGTVDFDKTEREMQELKAMLMQSMK